MRAPSLLPDLAAIGAERHDNALQVPARERLERLAGALAEHLGFVVVQRHPARLIDEAAQLGAVEHRQALARIEDEAGAGVCQLLGVLEHGIAAVGRNDRDLHVVPRRHRSLVRRLHRPGMEGGDLVVVGVGDDDRLRRIAVFHGRDVPRVDAPARQTLQVLGAVVADGGQHHRLAAERGQVVGDVAGAASELSTQRGHQEADVQDVDLLGQDLLRKAAREVGDGVERE